MRVCVLLVLLVLLGRGDAEEKRSLRSEEEHLTGGVQYLGRPMSNNCPSLFNNRVINGRTCRPPCNNPCSILLADGCGAGVYCACSNAPNDPWKAKPPVAKCSWCPYTPAGTSCPGDGLWYDKSFPAAAPVAKAPVRPPVTVAPACGDYNKFGTCDRGFYCRQKSTDWSYVCTACPSGMTCPGDGTRKKPPSNCGAAQDLHDHVLAKSVTSDASTARKLLSPIAAALIAKAMAVFCPVPAASRQGDNQ